MPGGNQLILLTGLHVSIKIVSTMASFDQVLAGHTINAFLLTHAVFTVDDVRQYLAERGSENPNTRKALLAYHRSCGRMMPVRRGLYASVPPNTDAATFSVDPFLVAAKMTEDAVLAYHTALEYHGKAYSGYNRLTYTSQFRSPATRFRGFEYLSLAVPHSLLESGGAHLSIETHPNLGVNLMVTNLERTFVDVLDRPEVSGSWEEIWRSLESVEFFDLGQVVAYLEHLGNATTAAKVGFYLSQHRETLMVDDDTFAVLKTLIPKQPHYMDRRSRNGCHLVSEWNLVVPREVLERSWEEVS